MTWTRDAAGKYVDWTKPPYQQPGSGLVVLLLANETARQVSGETMTKRIQEYAALAKRALKNPQGAMKL